MKALLSATPLAEPGRAGPPGPNPPLLDSTAAEDLLAHLRSLGVSDVAVPEGDPLRSMLPEPVPPWPGLSPAAGEAVLVVAYAGPVRLDRSRLERSYRRSGADCVIALSAGGRRSSLSRVAVGPRGEPVLVQEAGHPQPLTNLRDTGLRMTTGERAAEVLRAGLGPAAYRLGPKVLADTSACRYCRDLLSAESYLLCCYEMLTGAAEWYGPCGSSPGSVIHPTARLDSPPGGNVWLAEGVSVGQDTVLRRTVVLPRASVGDGCRLDSTLVLPGTRVPDGTDRSDKYLSILGLDGGSSNG